MSKRSTTITQSQTSMMANGRVGPQISQCHAFNSAPTRVKIGKHVWAEWLHQPCHLGGPCVGKTTTSPLPCPGPMSRRNKYITHAVSGAHVWVEWLHHPCRLGGPCVGGMATSPLPSRGAHVWVEWLPHTCYLGGPCVDGMPTSPLPSRGPMRGQNGYITPTVSAGHVWAEWLHHPYRVPGPCPGGMATSPLPSRGPMCGRNAYITPTVSGAPRGRMGYIISAVLGAHVWVEWLPEPCRLGGPSLGGLATSPGGVAGAGTAGLAPSWVC